MNRYILIRRLYGPAFLLLVGVDALLNQAGILSWGQSWPLFLILIGVLKLAERAAMASEEIPQWPGTAVPPQPGVSSPAASPAASEATSAIVPAGEQELVKHTEEGGRQ